MNSKYSDELLHQYVSGKLSPGEMHALEKEIANDPMLAEALEGYLANQQVDLRTLNNESRNAIIKKQTRRAPVYALLNWRAAAVLVGLAGAAIWLLPTRENPESPNTNNAINQQKPDTVVKKPGTNTQEMVQKKTTPQSQPTGEPSPLIPEPENNKVGYGTGRKNNDFRLNGFVYEGTVTDEHGKPIEQAHVFTEGKLIDTKTDQSGRFQFRSLDTVLQLHIEKPGYLKKESRLKAGTPEIQVLKKS